MCKILAVPFCPEKSDFSFYRLVTEVTKEMNKTDPHGTGMMGVFHTPQGDKFEHSIGIRRWLNPKETFSDVSDGTNYPEVIKGLANALEGVGMSNAEGVIIPELAPVAKKKGKKRDSLPSWNFIAQAKSLVIHARYATTPRCLENVHPFTEQDFNGNIKHALVHNGVIHNVRELLGVHAHNYDAPDCDSYALLRQWVDGCYFETDMDNVEEFAAMWERQQGYAATCVYSQANSLDDCQLTVTRDDRACLGMVFVPKWNTPIYCTAIGLVKDMLNEMRIEYQEFVIPNFSVHQFSIGTRTVMGACTADVSRSTGKGWYSSFSGKPTAPVVPLKDQNALAADDTLDCVDYMQQSNFGFSKK